MARKPLLEKHQDVAIEQVQRLMENRLGSQRLTVVQLAEQFPQAIAGWSTSLDINKTNYDAYLVINRYFPYTRPYVFLPTDSLLKNSPHVGKDGKLCLEAGHVSFAHRRPVEVVKYILQRAEECLSLTPETARMELIEEFQSYWDQQPELSSRQALTLVQAKGPSRKIFYFDGEHKLLFGDNRDDLLNWIKNLTSDEDRKLHTTVLIWLDGPLIPSEFPKTSKALGELVKHKALNSYEMLTRILPRDHSSVAVLIGFDTKNGPALVAVTLSEPCEISLQNGKTQTKSLVMRGFRPGKIPTSILADRYLRSVPLAPSITRRADPTWMYSRGGHEVRTVSKLDKRVVIVGCGSLGSAVTLGLAKCGVTKLTLIDGDLLKVDNVARHVLGVSDVGPLKEIALKRMLLRQLPHTEVVVYSGKRWQDVYSENSASILESDLIISTTGDWACDEPLNAVIRVTAHTNAPPIIFGWLEPFGCAGQALCKVDPEFRAAS